MNFTSIGVDGSHVKVHSTDGKLSARMHPSFKNILLYAASSQRPVYFSCMNDNNQIMDKMRKWREAPNVLRGPKVVEW